MTTYTRYRVPQLMHLLVRLNTSEENEMGIFNKVKNVYPKYKVWGAFTSINYKQ